MHIPLRYWPDSSEGTGPILEQDLRARTLDVDIPLEESALVLVDLWNEHFIKSWLDRAGRLMKEQIVPVIEAARRAGLPVIHAPSPRVAPQYPEHLARHAPTSPSEPADWPPPEFRRREGRFASIPAVGNRPPDRRNFPDRFTISPLVEVRDEDALVETGQQLHEHLRAKRILHLFYAGFATNWCIVNRNYGIRAMAGRGYNCILLRDATTGIEFPDTLDTLFTTEMAIREVEQQYGWSCATEDYFTALRT